MLQVKFVQHRETAWKYRAVRHADRDAWMLNDIRSPFVPYCVVDSAGLEASFERLRLLLSVDFDGTIAELIEFPNVGDLIVDAQRVLNRLHKEGHRLLLNTCREGDGMRRVKEALQTFSMLHLFEKFNEQADDVIQAYEIDCRKIYAHFYFGDDAFGWPGWLAVEDYFLEGGYGGRPEPLWE